jgi:hypothetical protein
LTIKHVDHKRAFIRLNRIRGWPKDRPYPHPAFLDLKTLAFALTNESYSLARACEAFGIAQGKSDPGEHGHITPEYIDYARQDVRATEHLLVALRQVYDQHPIDLPPEQAYSPASIAKAYLRAMGVTPRLERQPDFPRWVLGAAMHAYYGGRAECAIRRLPIPIVYTDVLSMYPTVNILLNLWRLHVASRVEVEECTTEVQALLKDVAAEGVAWVR